MMKTWKQVTRYKPLLLSKFHDFLSSVSQFDNALGWQY